MTAWKPLILGLLLLAGACGSGANSAPQAAATAADVQVHQAEVASASRSPEQRLADGERLYGVHCQACHQATGKGLAGAFPPLAGADYLLADPERAIGIVLGGKSGPIEVNGVTYNAVMPNMSYLGDVEVADILTYTLNAWGNDGGTIAPAQVAAARAGQADVAAATPAEHPVDKAGMAYQGTPSPIPPEATRDLISSEGPPMTP